jgi:hypothetical protein
MNPENGEIKWFNGFSSKQRKDHKKRHDDHEESVGTELKSRGIPLLSLSSEESIFEPLTRYFKSKA